MRVDARYRGNTRRNAFMTSRRRRRRNTSREPFGNGRSRNENWFAAPELIMLSCIATALYLKGITSRACGVWFDRNMPYWKDYTQEDTTLNALVQRGHKGRFYENEYPWVHPEKKPYWERAKQIAAVDGYLLLEEFEDEVKAVLFGRSKARSLGVRQPSRKQQLHTMPEAVEVAAPSQEAIDNFYGSFEWRKLRYATLIKYGRTCMCCGKDSGVTHVDHVQPIRRFWHLRLDPDNLQVLCEECNHGKGSWDMTDFR